MAVQSHARPLRVLYLHGFEETADSPKPQALIKDPRFDVLIPPLKVHFKQSSSPLVYALKLPLLWTCLTCGIVASALLGTMGGWRLAPSVFSGYAVTAVCLYVRRHALIADAVSGAYTASLGVAMRALLSHRPDVVVGFSWGGALALDLAKSGGPWQGPMVLLAPAHEKLLTLRGRLDVNRAPPRFALPVHGPTVVIHSTADTLIPIENSRRLCGVPSAPVSDNGGSDDKSNGGSTHSRPSAARLIEIQNDPHKMWSVAAPEGKSAESLLVKSVLEVTAARSSTKDKASDGKRED